MFKLRYSTDHFGYSGTVSPVAFELYFWRQLHENLQVGAEFNYNERTSRALSNIYYQWLFKDTVVRALIDSDCVLGATYSKRIKDLSSNISFSVLLNVPLQKVVYGFKMDINAYD